MADNETGLVAGGAFETPPPERPPMQITDFELLTNVQKVSVSRNKSTIKLLMSNHFPPPHLPQTHVGGWFFKDFYLIISPTLLSQMYPHNSRKKLAANEKGLWQVGNLKRYCPNVRRYKLLLFNYLPMFKRFPSAETKVQ